MSELNTFCRVVILQYTEVKMFVEQATLGFPGVEITMTDEFRQEMIESLRKETMKRGENDLRDDIIQAGLSPDDFVFTMTAMPRTGDYLSWKVMAEPNERLKSLKAFW